jgi:hypothetical protein
MPSVSQKQHNFFAAVAKNPKFAKKAGVSQSVGAEFLKADKGLKFGKGSSRADIQKANRPKTEQGKSELFAKGGDMKDSKMNPGFMAMMAKKKAPAKKMANGGMTTAKMGAVKTAAPSKDGIASKGKTKGTMVKMGAAKPLGMKRGGKC